MITTPDLVVHIDLDTSGWDSLMARLGDQLDQLFTSTTPTPWHDLVLQSQAYSLGLSEWDRVDPALVALVRDQAAADGTCRPWSVPDDQGWALATPHRL